MSEVRSIILRVAHSDKKKAEVAEYFYAACCNVNYFLIAVESEDHDDAHEHGEKGQTDREVNWGADGAHRDDHCVPDHYLREVLHDLVRDALHPLLLPLFECRQLLRCHVLQLGLVFYHF